MTPRILLTGKSGQLGHELSLTLPTIGELTALDRSQLDLQNESEIRRIIRDLRPTLIVNAAAYTAVDKAESDQAAARAINTDAPRILAEEAKTLGAILVHFSTDYVFAGSAFKPYTETDPTSPLNVYGITKLAGEEAIQKSGTAHLIFRTSWLYGRRGHNFLLTILKLASQRKDLRVVCDQRGAPTSVIEIARATTAILQRSTAQSSQPALAQQSGLFHLSAAGETNWHEFAQTIVQFAKRTGSQPRIDQPRTDQPRIDQPWIGQSWIESVTEGRPIIVDRILPISTDEYPTPARRPRYSVLSNAKLKNTFQIELSHWRKQLEEIFTIESGSWNRS
jgi:dTDP-4-dehydrorhamnose reductase